MASQVLSGSSNPSYTNNTGQNVRILINYMASCTSMTWAGVTVSGSSSAVGKEVMTINGELRTAFLPGGTGTGPLEVAGKATGTTSISGGNITVASVSVRSQDLFGFVSDSANIFYVPLTVTRGGSFPNELVLSNGQSFSAVSGAYNILVIKEDGT